MKTIFRTKHTAHFTTLPNKLLRDKELSFRARGVLAMVLSNCDEWEVTQVWLRDQGLEGKEAIAASLRELEVNGYAVFAQERNGSGLFIRGIWTFYDAPVEQSQRTKATEPKGERKPVAGEPLTGKPVSGEPVSGNPPLKKDHPEEGLFPELPAPAALSERDRDALEIYEAYPKKAGKPDALRAIKKALKVVEAPRLLELTRLFCAARKAADPQFTPFPATWFNQQRFNDDPGTWVVRTGASRRTLPAAMRVATPAELARDAAEEF